MGPATGTYVAALSIGAFAAALTMVPLANALGGWRPAFAVSVLPTLLALPLWLVFQRRDRSEAVDVAARSMPRGGPGAGLPSRRGWLLAAVFGLQSMCYAAVISWVVELYVRAGWSAATAALAPAAVSLLNVPAALVIPALSDGRDRGKWLLGRRWRWAWGCSAWRSPRLSPRGCS